jgi:hypothetical protein
MTQVLVISYFLHILCDSKEVTEHLLKMCLGIVRCVIQYIVTVVLIGEEYFVDIVCSK